MWNPAPASSLPRWERLAAAAVDFLVLLVPEFVIFDLIGAGPIGKATRFLRAHPKATVAQLTHAVPGIQTALDQVVILAELVTAVYLIAMTLAFGATLGKLLLGIRVQSVSGRPLSARDAVLRSAAFWLPALLTYVIPIIGLALWIAVFAGGTVMILSRPDRRAIEDFLGRSIVVSRAQVGTSLEALIGAGRGGGGASGGHLPGWGPPPGQTPAEPAPTEPAPTPGSPGPG